MTKKKQKISYEEAVKQLETIVSVLEKGELSLEDSLNEFKKGVELYKYCYGILNEVEGEVKIILDNDNNNIEEMDFTVSP